MIKLFNRYFRLVTNTHNEKILLYIIYIIFFCIITLCVLFKNSERGWPVITHDTASYFNIKPFENPWFSVRTPGTYFYYSLLGQSKIIRFLLSQNHIMRNLPDSLNKEIEQNILLKSYFKKLELINAVLFTAGLIFLVYSIKQFLLFTVFKNHPILSILFISSIAFIIIFLGNIGPMNTINADPIVQILTPYFAASILLFIKSKKLFWLYFSIILSSFSFLVKPAFAFLPFINGLIILGLLFNTKFKIAKKVLKLLCSLFMLSLTTLIWPFWLYFSGGILVPSQISAYTNSGYIYFTLLDSDLKLFENKSQYSIIASFLALRKENNININFQDDNLYTIQEVYRKNLNPLIWRSIPDSLSHYIDHKKYLISYNSLIKSIFNPVIKENLDTYFRIILSNFLVSFNQLLPQRYAYAWWISDHYIRTLIVIIIAVMLGVKTYRIPIVFFTLIHSLHMAFCSIGSCIELRYVATTEYFLLIAFFLSLLSLLSIIKIKSRIFNLVKFHLN